MNEKREVIFTLEGEETLGLFDCRSPEEFQEMIKKRKDRFYNFCVDNPFYAIVKEI